MHPSESARVRCPSCGQGIELAIDASVDAQEYIEDCEVCCKPMAVRVRLGADGELSVEVRGENE